MTATPFVVPDDPSVPFPVPFDRLLTVVDSMGYEVDVLVEGRAAGAVFDGVPVLLSLDATGRFVSVRAVWDTGRDPSSCAQAIFAAADGWNREKYFPTVYWIPSDTGTLQVCADFIVDTRAGLTDTQLAENLGAGISTGISAIGYMKEAATHALGWGDQPEDD
ncbi:YbjN domain-containing protein [Actinomyces polynesiensis]|uniref:YbjN domain-containing protein n=1 Tax=Actinomyces polynesiensis TaxID=1325934 RepID=UPI0005BCC89D|nr:YbjN domain-containing protein [Actinomyces polynesiensis]